MKPIKKSGARADLVAELREDVGYWGFIGNEANLSAASDGASALANGAASVEVGHTLYVVDEPTDT